MQANIEIVNSYHPSAPSASRVPAVTTSEIVEQLRKNRAFSQVDTEALMRLANAARVQRLAARTRMITAGAQVNDLVLLMDGVVRVYQTDPHGRQVTVKHLKSPNSLFEMELITRGASFGSAETLTQADLVYIPAAEFLTLVESDSVYCQAILKEVCARLCVATRHSRAVLFDVECRLASLLLSYTELFGRPVDSGVRINIKLTQDDLANGIGVVVRSVSRTLAAWKKRGLVSIRKGWYVVHDPAALEAATNGFKANLNHTN